MKKQVKQIVNVPNKIDIQTVQVGDRVKFAKSLGTVKVVSSWSRLHGHGVILWDDGHEVESPMSSWKNLQKE